MNEVKSSRKFILLYYVVLFTVMVLMGSVSAPSTVVRLTFLAAIVVPLFWNYDLLAPVIICSLSLISATNSVLYLPLPYTNSYYYAIILLVLVIQDRKSFSHDGLLPFILFWLLVEMVDGVTGSQIVGMKEFFPLLLLLGLSCSGLRGETRFVPIFLNAFCLLSILSSILYFINYQNFVVNYNQLGLERSGWSDPNYFSCMIGMGMVSAIIQLIMNQEKSRTEKTFWIITIMISFIAQVTLASRGGILATVISFVVALIYVKIPIKYKLLISLAAAVFVIFLYNNGYFELLAYRFVEDEGGGSGRTDIWNHKLTAFFQDGNPLNWLFGYGNEGGLRLGYSYPQGVHNEYIALLVEYGFIGLGFFLYTLVESYKQAFGKNKPLVLILSVYLITVCLTLEPLTQGNFVYMSFFLLICVISRSKSLEIDTFNM